MITWVRVEALHPDRPSDVRYLGDGGRFEIQKRYRPAHRGPNQHVLDGYVIVRGVRVEGKLIDYSGYRLRFDTLREAKSRCERDAA